VNWLMPITFGLPSTHRNKAARSAVDAPVMS
jgi:hypothetical protein